MQEINHIGIIMDGNGRWAQSRHRPRTFGHIKGARVAKKIITASRRMGLKNLTLYAFSTENWLRPEEEVQFLMNLLGRYLKRELAQLIEQNIRFTVIGDISRLPKLLQDETQKAIRATAHCTGMNLIFALSYGSRAEIVEAAKAVAQKVRDDGLDLNKIDEALFSAHLSTYPAPELDLVIRTSGEQRLSNFLLWQAAYAEFFFSETLWPDFTEAEFQSILNEFGSRERRFGRVHMNTPLSQSKGGTPREQQPNG
jgi:undecaprenyl diphosphate synthase